MRARLSLILVTAFAMSCKLHTETIEPVEEIQLEPTEPADPILDNVALPIRDVLEEGFCYDDIYASYLRKTYVGKHQHELKRFRSARSRRRHRINLENRSLFYARSRLVSPVTSYFGALPVVGNERVEFWIRYFQTRGRHTFIRWLVRAESFKEVVEPVLQKEGLPPEMFFLAMVESGFSNTAYSRKRATGTWQFMGPTARVYNLKINHWVDERRDPIKSTHAAAKYLKDLYSQFGDWYLAMAAYNAGPGTIRRAIRKTGSRDFWEISRTRWLRSETKHYVPKVLAALTLAKMHETHYDLAEDPANKTPQSIVKLQRPVMLSEVAKKLNIPLKTLRRWNPEIIRDITPPLRGNHFYPLRLPSPYLAQFAQIEHNLSRIKVTDVLMYKVRRGDTLYNIARRYKVSVSKIRAVNPRIRPKTLRIGKTIAIPVPGVITRAKG